MRAYIVISTEAGKPREVARQIAGLPGVKMADACWGSRDVFAIVEVGTTKELNKLVMDRIHRLEGVRETNTHIALDQETDDRILGHQNARYPFSPPDIQYLKSTSRTHRRGG